MPIITPDLPPVALFAPAQQPAIQSDAGGVGLLQVPSARMAPDGQIALSLSDTQAYRFYAVSMQFLPRLEATIRYTDVPSRPYGPASFSGNQSYKDKSQDFKVLLARESEDLPAIAMGIRDITGTGIFSGEYFVASKALGSFDLSLGMGWGYQGARGALANPLCKASAHFCVREPVITAQGGNFDITRFFTGRMSPFGGVAWQTPWQSLRLLAELDGNNYRNDFAQGIRQNSSINLGMVYSLSDSSLVKLGWERGNALTVGVSVGFNLHKLNQPKLMPAPLPLDKAPPATVAQWQPVADLLASNAGLQVQGIRREDDTLVVIGEQRLFRFPDEGQARAARILEREAPADIARFRVVESRLGMPLSETNYMRAAAVDAFTPSDRQPDFREVRVVQEPAAPAASAESLYTPPALVPNVRVAPFLAQSFGGPEGFVMYQIGVRANGSLRLGENELATSLVAPALDNYDKFRFLDSNSELPKVRTRIREYVAGRPLRTEQFQLTHFFQPMPALYGQVYAGYLELMFAGVGGELLYRPLGSTWGLGLDVNEVRQRSPHSETALESYQVTTGHLSLYKEFPDLLNLRAIVQVGQFLAGDRGINLNVARRFDSGIMVGGYLARTNVSAEQFGEGSFNKGFYMSVPLDVFTIRNTTTRATVGIAPITRDGGQMLSRRYQLWDVTETRGEAARPLPDGSLGSYQ